MHPFMTHSHQQPLPFGPKGPRRGPHGHGRGRGRGFGPGFGPGGPGFEPGDAPFAAFGPFVGGPGGPGRGRRGPGRGRRGDVRNAVLALLAEGPKNGYQLIAAISEKTEGLWRPSPGSIYPALGLLEDEGLIEPSETESGKAFALTPAGRGHVEEHADELKEPWAKVAGPHASFLDVRSEIRQLAMAVQQVVMTGNKDQIAAARTVLDDARKGIYRMLAGDG